MRRVYVCVCVCMCVNPHVALYLERCHGLERCLGRLKHDLSVIVHSTNDLNLFVQDTEEICDAWCAELAIGTWFGLVLHTWGRVYKHTHCLRISEEARHARVRVVLAVWTWFELVLRDTQPPPCVTPQSTNPFHPHSSPKPPPPYTSL